MKLRHYKKYTYQTCIRFCKCQSDRNKKGLIALLKRWSKSNNDGKLNDYGYTGKCWWVLLERKLNEISKSRTSSLLIY